MPGKNRTGTGKNVSGIGKKPNKYNDSNAYP
jgi:hypothetical protein